MKKLLLVIDCQYDFLDGGKLGVDGSTEKIDNLTKYIKEHGKDYEMAIATVDWHPITHCSFKDNGGIWPIHCVQHSMGSAIYESLLFGLNVNTNHFEILTKGLDEDHEEYSIFKNRKSCEKLVNLVNGLGIEEIDVCGIALNYCVKDSLLDGKRTFPHIKFRVLKDFCPCIGEEVETLKYLEENNFEIV